MTTTERNERRNFLVNQCSEFITGVKDDLIEFILERHPDFKRVGDDYKRDRTEYKNSKNNTWLIIDIPDNFLPKTISIWIHGVGIKNVSVVWDFNKIDLLDMYENRLKKVL